MNNDLNLKVFKFYSTVNKIHDEINNKLFNFIIKANELVELTEGDYQIEKTLKLNKISLKGFILDSECCTILNDNNIRNYSINELKNYFTKFEKQFDEDYSKYFLALSLYEQLEEIEKQVDIKIDLEIEKIGKLIPNISDIQNVNSSEYEQLYIKLKNQLDRYVNLDKLDKKSFTICIQILNDIFNFYISGYPNIPEEYLYHNED